MARARLCNSPWRLLYACSSSLVWVEMAHQTLRADKAMVSPNAAPQRGRTSKRRAESDTPIDSSKSRAPASSRSASLCGGEEGPAGAQLAAGKTACITCATRLRTATLERPRPSGLAVPRGIMPMQYLTTLPKNSPAATCRAAATLRIVWTTAHTHTNTQPAAPRPPACWLLAAGSTPAGPPPPPAHAPPPPAVDRQAQGRGRGRGGWGMLHDSRAGTRGGQQCLPKALPQAWPHPADVRAATPPGRNPLLKHLSASSAHPPPPASPPGHPEHPGSRRPRRRRPCVRRCRRTPRAAPAAGRCAPAGRWP